MREVFERARDLYSQRGGSALNVAFALLLEGRPEEALAISELESTEVFVYYARAIAFHDLGRLDESRQALQFVIENSATWLAYQIAEAFAYMQDVDSAFQWLETSVELRDGGINYLVVDPLLDPLHKDPRWEPLLLNFGLLDAWQNLQAQKQGDTP